MKYKICYVVILMVFLALSISQPIMGATTTFSTKNITGVVGAPFDEDEVFLLYFDEEDYDISFQVRNTTGASIIAETDLATFGWAQDTGLNSFDADTFDDTYALACWVEISTNKATYAIVNKNGTTELGPISIGSDLGVTQRSVACRCYDNNTFRITMGDVYTEVLSSYIYYKNGTNIAGPWVEGAYSLTNRQPISMTNFGNDSSGDSWVYREDDYIFYSVRHKDGTSVSATALDADSGGAGRNIETSIEAFDNDSAIILIVDSYDNDISYHIMDKNGSTIKGETDIDTTITHLSYVSAGVLNGTKWVAGVYDSTDGDISFMTGYKNGTTISSWVDVDTSGGRAVSIVANRIATGNSLYPNHFVILYKNSTNKGLMSTYDENGTVWSGIAGNSAPTMTTPVFNESTLYGHLDVNISSTYTDLDLDSGTVLFKVDVDGTNVYNKTFSSVASGTSLTFSLDSANYSEGETVNVSVNATDGTNLSIAYFSVVKTVANFPPDSATLVTPANESTGLTSIVLNVTVVDEDGETMDVVFLNTSNDAILHTASTITSGSYANYTWTGLDSGATYEWYVNVTDGTVNTTSSNWTFSTNYKPVVNNVTWTPTTVYTNTSSINIKCNISDSENSTLVYYYKGFLNDVLNFSGNVTAVANNTLASVYNLTSSNTSKGQNWTFSCAGGDGDINSSYTNSSVLTISNSIPSAPVLASPTEGETLFSLWTWLNYSSVDGDSDTITYYVYGDSSSPPTTLIYNGTSVSYNWSSLIDGNDYYWLVKAGDSLANSSNSTIKSFSISATSPAININSPLNDDWIQNTTVIINYTATDSNNVDTCRLYGNFSGVWALNQTMTSVTSGVATNFTPLILNDESKYLYTIWCNDTNGNADYYYQNISFGVDITNPTLSVSSPTSSAYHVQTVTLSAEANDTYFDHCSWLLYYDDTSTLKNSNTSWDCGSDITLTTPYYAGGYILYVYSYDEANNSNYTTVSFTSTEAVTGGDTSSGGGGSTSTDIIIIDPYANQTVITFMPEVLKITMRAGKTNTGQFKVVNSKITDVKLAGSLESNSSDSEVLEWFSFEDNLKYMEIEITSASGLQSNYIYLNYYFDVPEEVKADVYKFNILFTDLDDFKEYYYNIELTIIEPTDVELTLERVLFSIGDFGVTLGMVLLLSLSLLIISSVFIFRTNKFKKLFKIKNSKRRTTWGG